MIRPEKITKVLAESLIPEDLELPKDLMDTYSPLQISKVWAAGSCFLYTRNKEGRRRVYAFVFDLKKLACIDPENFTSTIREAVRAMRYKFVTKLQTNDNNPARPLFTKTAITRVKSSSKKSGT